MTRELSEKTLEKDKVMDQIQSGASKWKPLWAERMAFLRLRFPF